ncbi:hypothetical protein SASC598P14_005670 [Snodgrassella alvi SCGC AB-598-P14]|nr:hypothetical protein SASC598P14_005670 [Snodgrassella alvi SCGC AB-598-P14]
MNYYLGEGYLKEEALVMTSMDLGLGGGKDNYIKIVYGKKGEEDK